MEDNRFDKLIREKLAGAAIPEYNESKWLAFSRLLTQNSIVSNWKLWTLLALLLLSNGYWGYNQLNLSNVNAGNSTISRNHDLISNPSSINGSTVLYDTIYRTIEVEKIVYQTKYIRLEKSIDSNTPSSNFKLKDDIASDELISNQLNESVSFDQKPVSQFSPSENTGIDSTVFSNNLAVNQEQASELDSVETEESLTREINKEIELIKSPKIKYQGDRILVGMSLFKPFLVTGSAKDFNSSGLGIQTEYVINRWMRLSGGLNYTGQKYSIDDPNYFSQIIALEEINIFDPNNPYGNFYDYLNSDVILKSFQLSLGIQLSPFKMNNWRPYLGAYYIQNFSSNVSVTNRLNEIASDKIILVESSDPGNQEWQYVITDLGVETAINDGFRFRFGIDYWYKLNENQYSGNLFGINAGLFYRIK